MTVIGIKLISGEELICRDGGAANRFTGDTASKLEMPRVIGVQETQQGIGLGFMPYFLGNPDADLFIEDSRIIARYEPVDKIAKTYLQQTSRIQLMG